MLALASHSLRPRQKAERRRRIYEAALHLTRNRGFDQFTMADVADAAEVSRATVFNYFPSKDDFLAEYHREMTRAALEPPPDAGPSGLGNVQSLLERLCTSAENNRQVARAIVSRIFVAPQLQQADCEDETDLLSWLTRAFDHAQRVGELKQECSPDTVARIVIAILSNSALDWVADSARGSLGALMQPQISLLFSALGNR